MSETFYNYHKQQFNADLSLNGATTLSGATTITNNNINIGSTISNVMSVDTSNNIILQNTLNGLPSSAFGGCSVISSDGTTLAVSAPNEADLNGVVRIYTRTGTTITLQGTLVATSSFFGISLAISSDGNTLAVGAHPENSNTGSVRIYTRSSGVWNNTPQGSFTGASTNVYFSHGLAISSDGNVLVVGSYGETTGTGAVRTYLRTGNAWALQGSAMTGTAINQNYGVSVALDPSGNTLAVGAHGATSAYVYTRANNSTTSWTQKGTTQTSGISNSGYGVSIAISSDGNTLVVSSRDENSTTGAVRVYLWNGSAWNIQGSALSTGIAGGYFGRYISMSSDGNVLAITSIYEALSSGAVRIYKRTNGTWSQIGDTLSTGITGSQFGYSVSITADGNTFVVGSNGENSSGAVRVYTRNLSSSLNLRGGMISISGDVLDITSNSININSSVVVGSAAPQPNFVLANPANIPAPQKITTASAGVNGDFGRTSIAYSGDGTIMAVGIEYDSTYGTNLGSVVIYVKSTANGSWVQQQKLNGPTNGGPSLYGSYIALTKDGSRMYVTAPCYVYNGLANAGAVYIYKKRIDAGGNGMGNYEYTNWIPSGSANGNFGSSIARSDNGYLVVGQNGNNNVAIYNSSDGYITNISDSGAFGTSVAISSDGSVIAVGGHTFSSNRGQVRIYSFNGSATPTLVATFTGADASTHYFGISVSLSSDGNTLAVGAPAYNSNEGIVYIYSRTNGSWALEGNLRTPSPVANRYFGRTVTLSSNGDMVASGAYQELPEYGAAYIWRRSSAGWYLYKRFTQSDYLYNINWSHGSFLSPDGGTLAIGCAHANVPLYVYSLKTPQLTLAVGDSTTPGRLVVTSKSGESFTRFQTDSNNEWQRSGIEFGIPRFTSDQRAKITSTTFSSNGSDLQFHTNPSGSYTTALPRMTIASGGHVCIGTASPDPVYRLTVNSGGNPGQFSCQKGDKTNLVVYTEDPAGSGWNASQSILWLTKANGTNRSINAAGTINNGGTDYAEYMYKSGDFVVNKGDICGIDSSGNLTNLYDEAYSFVVKSTNPSVVGGDLWGTDNAIGKSKPVDISSNATDEEKEKYQQDLQEWKTLLENARQKVDRIAFCGQVPLNIDTTNVKVGDHIIPNRTSDGKIEAVSVSKPTFDQYQSAVGKVINILSSTQANIIVKIC